MFALLARVSLSVYRNRPAHLDRMLTFGFHYANKMLSVYAADGAYRLSLTVAKLQQQY